MYIDAIIRPKAVSNGTTSADAQRTIFSRNKDDNSSVGAEDFFALYIRADNVLEASWNTKFTATFSGQNIDDDEWEYVKVRWKYDSVSPQTSIVVWKRVGNVVGTNTYNYIAGEGKLV